MLSVVHRLPGKMYVLCFLFALLVVVHGQAGSSECNTAREKALKVTAPGRFVPHCEADGTYRNLQCHEGTQFCQCWTNDGDVITQPSTKIKKCECILKKHEVERKFPANGQRPRGTYIPQCLDNGGFKTQQCHSSTGLCWCVNEQGVKQRDLERGANC